MPRPSQYPATLPHSTGQGCSVPATFTEDISVESGCQVLIVDAVDETRDVLRTALERCGRRTLTASGAAEGLEMAQTHRPELIVLDLEIDGESPDELAARFAQQSPPDQTSLVLLGSIRRPAIEGEYVAKPYHYAPLIRKIEEILSAK